MSSTMTNQSFATADESTMSLTEEVSHELRARLEQEAHANGLEDDADAFVNERMVEPTDRDLLVGYGVFWGILCLFYMFIYKLFRPTSQFDTSH